VVRAPDWAPASGCEIARCVATNSSVDAEVGTGLQVALFRQDSPRQWRWMRESKASLYATTLAYEWRLQWRECSTRPFRQQRW